MRGVSLSRAPTCGEHWPHSVCVCIVTVSEENLCINSVDDFLAALGASAEASSQDILYPEYLDEYYDYSSSQIAFDTVSIFVVVCEVVAFVVIFS